MTQSDKKHRVNYEIKSFKVLLVQGEDKPVLMDTSKARQLAEQKNLDLVELSVNQDNVSVCKILDYGAFNYREQKRRHEQEKKNKVQETKEVRLRPVTDDGDLNTKVKQMTAFLEKGHKVKVTIVFKGREIHNSKAGFDMMQRIEQKLNEAGIQFLTENAVKFEGKQITALYVINKKLVKKPQSEEAVEPVGGVLKVKM